ncbi:MAG: DUF4199 domain-containing protein [Verrucomicrobiota bacterium]
MKTCLTYGFTSALGLAFLTLGFFFLGFHSDAAKLASTQWISTLGGMAISVTCLVLGIRARRAETPAEQDFGYGRAVGAGALVTLFSVLFSSVLNGLYTLVVNPEIGEIMVQAQVAAMHAQGIKGEAVEAAEKIMRVVMHPLLQAIISIVGGMIGGTIISLIAAIFLRRKGITPISDAGA